MAKIIVVEDDEVCAGVIQDLLTHLGHTIEVVPDGEEGLARLRLYHYDLAVLDWELPNLSGVQMCETARQRGMRIPILMLTGKNTIVDKEEGFSSGADDYLTKPFDGRELLARVRALLRRPATYTADSLIAGTLELNSVTRAVTRNGVPCDLLPKEFALLEFLMQHQNQVFSLEDLLNQVWSSESDTSPDGIRKCVERIRRKIDEPGKQSLIETVHRVGYVFRPTTE
jgi:DNA-binding response OmpR family regulator